MTLKEILALPRTPEQNRSNSKQTQFSYGYTSCDHWFHWRTELTPEQMGEWWLEIAPTFLDDVSLYVVRPDGSYYEERTGDHIPHSLRSMTLRHFIIPLKITDNHTDYYLRVRTTSTLTLNLTLWQPHDYGNSASKQNMFYGVLFGLTLTAIMICMIGGLWFRERFYLVVAVFLFFNAFTHFTLNGFDHFLLYPESRGFADRMMGFAIFGGAASGLCLYLVFLRPYEIYPKFTQFCYAATAVFTLGALVSLAGYPQPFISAVCSIMVLLLMLALPILMLKHRVAPSVLMLLMFLPQWLSLTLQLARNFSLLPMVFWTTHIWAIMSMLLVPFVSVIVMMRVRAQENAYILETEKARLHRDLFSMVAHELRTPLAVVSSALANIEIQTAATRPDLAPRFSRANLSVARLNSLIDTALLEDRLMDENIELHSQWVGVDEVIAQLRDLRVIESPHQLITSLPSERLMIYIDTYWFGLALLNLLDNAIKYSPEGGEIVIQAVPDEQSVAIEIIDQGIGIPESARARVFEKFFRADNAQTLGNTSGLGLGLFLVYRILSLHGGALSYRPNPSGGSIFSCKVAAKKMDAEPSN